MGRRKLASGLLLCSLYVTLAAFAVVGDLTRPPSPLILPDMTTVIALPGLVLVMLLAAPLGVSEINGDNWLPIHFAAVAITAALAYLLGAAAEALLAAIIDRVWRPGQGLR